MRYKLVNSIIENDFATNLLLARGVTDVEAFLNPHIGLLHNPLLLDNMDKASSCLLSAIKKENCHIKIIVDCDVDGFTSAAIFYLYILKVFADRNIKITYEIHEGKQHGLEDMMDIVKNCPDKIDLLVLLDASSNDYEYHQELNTMGIPILVLDHHEASHYSEHAIVVNNQLSAQYPNKHLTGAGVTWQFCRYLDAMLNVNYAFSFIDLAALGLISDAASMVDLENRYIIQEGLSRVENFFFRVLIEKQSFSIGGKLTPIGVAFYITPLINAIIRVGSQYEKEKLFRSFINGQEILASTKRGEKGLTEMLAIQSARDCTNARNRQNKIKEEAIQSLEIKIFDNNLLDNKLLILPLDDEDQFPSELNGLVAMQLANKYKKPTIVARTRSGFMKGSARGLNESELADFKEFLNTSGLFEYCEGHANAFGVSLKSHNLETIHNYANDKLQNINFNENLYDVNFILDAKDPTINELVFSLDGIRDTYGQMNQEPLIAIENLNITKSDINIMGKNKDTVKITYNGTAYMFFRAKDFIEALEQSKTFLKMQIIGKPNINEYNGSVTPQIFVENWEIISSTDFDF